MALLEFNKFFDQKNSSNSVLKAVSCYCLEFFHDRVVDIPFDEIASAILVRNEFLTILKANYAYRPTYSRSIT